VIRKFDEDGDVGFVTDSWCLSMAYSLGIANKKLARPYVGALMSSDEILVLCDPDDPKTIWGWIAYDPKEQWIDWMLIRKPKRGQGLSKKLMSAAGIDSNFQCAYERASKRFQLRFNPWRRW
jgi:GNAT superfamily N-acetyltransferase